MRRTATARGNFGRGACLLPAACALGCCTFSSFPYDGPASAHCDGSRFHNQAPTAEHTFGDFLHYAVERARADWTEVTDAPPGPAPPERVGAGALRATFVGHSTVLLQLDGLNVLADPVWSDTVGPVEGAGPERYRPPGLRFEDLPPIDVVLVSHNHYDHMDLPTLLRLEQEHAPVFVTGLGNAAFLRHEGLADVRELDWWEGVRANGDVRIDFVPAQHFSGRGLCDQQATLWGGFVLVAPAGIVYYAGDTAAGPHFAPIRERYGAPRLAVLPIGAFKPRWFMGVVHMAPEEAVCAAMTLEAGTSLAIHFGTFRLADDEQDEPVRLLTETLAARAIPAERFWALDPGQGREVP